MHKKLLVLVLFGLISVSPLAFGQEFHLINGLPPGSFSALSFSPPSNDGTKVAGATAIGQGAAMWSEGKGVVPFKSDPSVFHVFSHGSAVAEDGSYFAGYLEYAPVGDPSDLQRGFFLWSESNGYQELSQPNDVPNFRPRGVSNGGSTLVGNIDRVGGSQIGIWKAGTGLELLGTAADEKSAAAISGDGTIVAAVDFGALEALRWTEATGFVALSDVAPSLTDPSIVRAITGNSILGMVGDSPFIWTGAQVDVLPFDIPGTITSMGADPADPANTLTILTQVDNEPTKIWTAAGGLRSLSSFLESELGLVTGLSYTQGLSLSSNGRNILGVGLGATGSTVDWIVSVPEPSTLALLGIAGILMTLRSVRSRR